MSEPKPSISALLARLFERTGAGIKFDLEVTVDLLGRLGNPQNEMSFVHVAGTNGKGSVCAMVESVLRAQGFRTGLYTSPHIIRFNERIRVCGECISDDAIAELFEVIDQHDRYLVGRGSREGTFFELTTVLALEYFRRGGVEVAVLETGMGGRLDATNVVDPVVTGITRIGMEHREYLGDTLAEITAEKCGIIKKGCPVVCGMMEEESLAVVQRMAKERKAPVIGVAETVSVRRQSHDVHGQKVKIETAQNSYPILKLPLVGPYQLENVATAVAVLECLGDCSRFVVDEKAVKTGLESLRWRGRCEVLAEKPLTILDVGHNASAALALSAALREIAKKRKVALVISLLADKDCAGIVSELAAMVGRCWAVQVKTSRGMPLDDLVACVRRAGLECSGAALSEAIAAARTWAIEHDGVVCIAGSLYLAGEVMELIGRMPQTL